MSLSEQINQNKTFHVEFEVVRLKDTREEDLDFTPLNEHQDTLKLGTYILIKKEFKKEITFSQYSRSSEKKQYDYQLMIKDEIMLYYKKILIVKKEDDELDIDFYQNSKYHHPGWLAEYEGLWIGET